VALGWCLDDLERARMRERRDPGITQEIWVALRRSTGRGNLSPRLSFPFGEFLTRRGIEQSPTKVP